MNFKEIYKSPDLKKNLTNSVYYFGGPFLQLILALFTQPIFSLYLEPSDFAIMGYFGAVQGFFIPLFSLNLTYYYLFEYWKENADNNKHLSFQLNFLTTSNILISAVSFIIIYLYFKILNINIPLFPYVFIIILNLFFEKYRAYYFLECRLNKQGLRFFIFNAIQVVSSTLFSLLLVVVYRMGAVGRLGGQTISLLILSIVAVYIFRKEAQYKFSFKFDFNKVKKALKFSYPLILAAYLYYPINNLDRLLLERLNKTNEFGYYNLGATIAGFVGTFFITLYMAFEPDFYKYTAQRDVKKYLKLSGLYIFILTGFTVVTIFVSNYAVAFLTSHRYMESTKYVNIFVISMYFYSVGNMFEQLFSSLNATKLTLYRTFIIAVISIGSYLLMIKHFEFIGASESRVIIFFLYLIVGLILFIWKFKNSLPLLKKALL